MADALLCAAGAAFGTLLGLTAATKIGDMTRRGGSSSSSSIKRRGNNWKGEGTRSSSNPVSTATRNCTALLRELGEQLKEGQELAATLQRRQAELKTRAPLLVAAARIPYNHAAESGSTRMLHQLGIIVHEEPHFYLVREIAHPTQRCATAVFVPFVNDPKETGEIGDDEAGEGEAKLQLRTEVDARVTYTAEAYDRSELNDGEEVEANIANAPIGRLVERHQRRCLEELQQRCDVEILPNSVTLSNGMLSYSFLVSQLSQMEGNDAGEKRGEDDGDAVVLLYHTMVFTLPFPNTNRLSVFALASVNLTVRLGFVDAKRHRQAQRDASATLSSLPLLQPNCETAVPMDLLQPATPYSLSEAQGLFERLVAGMCWAHTPSLLSHGSQRARASEAAVAFASIAHRHEAEKSTCGNKRQKQDSEDWDQLALGIQTTLRVPSSSGMTVRELVEQRGEIFAARHVQLVGAPMPDCVCSDVRVFSFSAAARNVSCVFEDLRRRVHQQHSGCNEAAWLDLANLDLASWSFGREADAEEEEEEEDADDDSEDDAPHFLMRRCVCLLSTDGNKSTLFVFHVFLPIFPSRDPETAQLHAVQAFSVDLHGFSSSSSSHSPPSVKGGHLARLVTLFSEIAAETRLACCCTCASSQTQSAANSVSLAIPGGNCVVSFSNSYHCPHDECEKVTQMVVPRALQFPVIGACLDGPETVLAELRQVGDSGTTATRCGLRSRVLRVSIVRDFITASDYIVEQQHFWEKFGWELFEWGNDSNAANDKLEDDDDDEGRIVCRVIASHRHIIDEDGDSRLHVLDTANNSSNGSPSTHTRFKDSPRVQASLRPSATLSSAVARPSAMLRLFIERGPRRAFQRASRVAGSNDATNPGPAAPTTSTTTIVCITVEVHDSARLRRAHREQQSGGSGSGSGASARVVRTPVDFLVVCAHTSEYDPSPAMAEARTAMVQKAAQRQQQSASKSSSGTHNSAKAAAEQRGEGDVCDCCEILPAVTIC